MRTRTLRLTFLVTYAVLVYLVQAQTLAVTGVARLPLSFFATYTPQFFIFQIGLLTMQLVGIIGMSLVNNRKKQEQTKTTRSVIQAG